MRNTFLLLLSVFSSLLVHGQITVTIVAPANNLVDTNFVTVKARVTPGEYEITSFVATIHNRSVSLINIGPYFQGNLSTSGLTIDSTYVLTVTATDVMGNQGVMTKNVIVDPPPKINIQLPVNHEVATPQLHLKADANDNSVCQVAVIVEFNDPFRRIIVDTFINSLDTTITLSDSVLQGKQGNVRFRVIDSKGQVLDSYRELYVESSPYLEKVFSTEGIIKDLNYGKLLSYFVNYSPDNNRNSLITNISTGVVSEIPGSIYNSNWSGAYGSLTPTGAVFFNNGNTLTDWNSGTLYPLGDGGSSSLFVAGPYVIWSGILFDGNKLYLRNTATRSTQLISSVSGNNNNGVSENGTVSFWANSMPDPADNGIYRYFNGVTTRINAGVYPMTDGKSIIYAGNGISLFDGTNNIQLSPSSGSFGDDYQVRNGWAAYTKPSLTGQKQVWLRDTAGVNTQITFYSTSSTINASGDGLGSDGSVCFNRNSTRYLYDKSSNKFKALSSTGFGRMYYRDSAWYMSIGRVLFKVKSNFINSYYTIKPGNWSNPATWYGNIVPPAGADVTIANNVVVDMDATCNTLTVKGNAAVTVNTGINLVVLH